mmetsp:Transcript_4545/g.13303  ORF Transcript_4545/g.13303 Transcript_4545/m.13303 type:complete len:474 (-) Transcript_4545:609-2030(-)
MGAALSRSASVTAPNGARRPPYLLHARRNAAAQAPAPFSEILESLPFVPLRVIALGALEVEGPIPAAHRVEHAVEHCHAEVGPRGTHAGDALPNAAARAEALHCAPSRRAVAAPDRVQLVTEHRHARGRSRAHHGRHCFPGVALGAEALHRLDRSVHRALPAANSVHHPVQDGNAGIEPRGAHGRDVLPSPRAWAEALGGSEGALDAVRAPHSVHLVFQRCHTHARPRDAHVFERLPRIADWAVALEDRGHGAVPEGAARAVESSAHLGEARFGPRGEHGRNRLPAAALGAVARHRALHPALVHLPAQAHLPAHRVELRAARPREGARRLYPRGGGPRCRGSLEAIGLERELVPARLRGDKMVGIDHVRNEAHAHQGKADEGQQALEGRDAEVLIGAYPTEHGLEDEMLLGAQGICAHKVQQKALGHVHKGLMRRDGGEAAAHHFPGTLRKLVDAMGMGELVGDDRRVGRQVV